MEMNRDTNNINHYIFSDFPPLTLSSLSPASSTHANPRKKRTKFLRIAATANPNPKPKPKPIKKPDPSAPKITPPCTECGKSFWSQKALFGHMRCHPERQWRGINPPPTFRRSDEDFTEEDHEVAACLLMIANGPTASATAAAASDTTACTVSQPTPDFSYSDRYPDQNVADAAVGTPTAAAAPNCGRFECTSCKKVFGSHQALGGHRASHKNVKGCYAITKNDGEGEEEEVGCCSGEMMMMILKDNCNNNDINGHKCSICFRVFSSGQALGGHMRCHWEKVEEQPPPPPSSRVCVFDLNLAPPLQEDGDASSLPYSSSGLALDLRLGF